jgi:hypothetical protein
MAEADHDLRKELEPVAPLVRDEDPKVLELGFIHLKAWSHVVCGFRIPPNVGHGNLVTRQRLDAAL